MVAPIRNIWHPCRRANPAHLDGNPSPISRNDQRIRSDYLPVNPHLNWKPVLSQLVNNPSLNLVFRRSISLEILFTWNALKSWKDRKNKP